MINKEGCICDGEYFVGFWVDGECWTCERKLSKKDIKDWIESDPKVILDNMEKLKSQRNKLNRKISTLKKALLKAT